MEIENAFIAFYGKCERNKPEIGINNLKYFYELSEENVGNGQ
jgi:hypothetical protein